MSKNYAFPSNTGFNDHCEFNQSDSINLRSQHSTNPHVSVISLNVFLKNEVGLWLESMLDEKSVVIHVSTNWSKSNNKLEGKAVGVIVISCQGLPGSCGRSFQSPQRCKLTTGRPLRSSPWHRRCRCRACLGCRSAGYPELRQSRAAFPGCGQLHELESVR